MPEATDLQKVAQYVKSNRAAPPDVHNAACRLLDKLNGPNGATKDTPPGRFAAGLRMIGCAVADAKNATQQDFALTGSETLGPNQEGCNDPECSRVECLHLGTCWEDEFWSEGPNGDHACGQAEAASSNGHAASCEWHTSSGVYCTCAGLAEVERLRAERDAARLIVGELQALRDSLYATLDSATAERDALEAEMEVQRAIVAEFDQVATEKGATIERVRVVLADPFMHSPLGAPMVRVDDIRDALKPPNAPVLPSGDACDGLTGAGGSTETGETLHGAHGAAQ